MKLNFTPKEHAKLLIPQSSRSDQYSGHFDIFISETFVFITYRLSKPMVRFSLITFLEVVNF